MSNFYAGIGSRETPRDIMRQMTEHARRFAAAGYILRSGAAIGADSAFEMGAGDQKEIWLPYLGFRNHRSTLIPTPEAFILAAKYHPKWCNLDRIGRQMHARNMHQVLGADLNTPVGFIMCWTADGKASGGTGQALRLAEDRGIQVINLQHGPWP